MVESSICSCSCTHCQNQSCNCSYCILIEDDDYDSGSFGEDDASLPPPPPPTMTSNPSHFIQEERYMNVATQFHRFVVLLKFFWKWHSQTKCRKSQIASHRTLLRRIILKWRSYSEERIQVFRSVFTIVKILNERRLRIVRCAFQMMIRQFSTLQFQEECFETWRRNVDRRKEINEVKLQLAREAYKTRHRVIHFQKWRYYTLVHVHQRKKEHAMRYRIFHVLKQMIAESNADEKEKTEIAMECFKRLCDRRIRAQFHFWNMYARSRGRMRLIASQIQRSYKSRLLIRSMRCWTKYHQSIKLAGLVLRNSRRRFLLTRWKMVVDNIKQDEILLMKIIVNRWWMYTQDILDRRRVRKDAHDHWANRRLKSCFSKWTSFTVNQRLRMKAPMFENRRISPNTPWTMMDKYNQDLRRLNHPQTLFPKLPTMMTTSFRYSSVPRMRLSESLKDYSQDIRPPRAMSRSLSPISYDHKTKRRSPFRNTVPNGKYSQKSFTLLDNHKTPHWVLKAISNGRFGLDSDSTSSKTYDDQTLRRVKYAEPKTYNEHDTFTLSRLNETVLSGSKESKPKYKCSKNVTYRPMYNNKEYKRYY